MMQSSPPPETTQEILKKHLKPQVVYEERLSKEQVKELKKPLFGFSGSVDLSMGKEPNVQNDCDLNIGRVVNINNWSDVGLVEGKSLKDWYHEIKASVYGHLVGGLDISESEIVGRLGISTGKLKLGDRLWINGDYYPISSKDDKDGGKNKFLWLRAGYNLGNGWNVGGMTRQFSNGNRAYNAWVSKGVGKGFKLKFNYWDIPNKGGNKRRYLLGISKSY